MRMRAVEHIWRPSMVQFRLCKGASAVVVPSVMLPSFDSTTEFDTALWISHSMRHVLDQRDPGSKEKDRERAHEAAWLVLHRPGSRGGDAHGMYMLAERERVKWTVVSSNVDVDGINSSAPRACVRFIGKRRCNRCWSR